MGRTVDVPSANAGSYILYQYDISSCPPHTTVLEPSNFKAIGPLLVEKRLWDDLDDDDSKMLTLEEFHFTSGVLLNSFKLWWGFWGLDKI